jgi:hypothetical protein
MLGDFSSVYKNLQIGLKNNGYHSILISDGDGWKKISSDISFTYKFNSRNLISKVLRQFEKYFLIFNILKKINITPNDVILIANPIFIPLIGHKKLLKFITARTENIFLSAMGDDWHYLKNNGRLKYWPYMNQISIYLRRTIYKIRDLRVLQVVKKIIPNCYDYRFSYLTGKFENKLSETIPFPLHITESGDKKFIKRDKLYIFHPLNREIFKGSKLIIKALKILEKKYPSLINVTIKGKVSFNDFMELIKNSDIVVDQCKSYSYGMSALIALEKGKIVLSGVENEAINDLRIPIKTPFLINITPDLRIILSTLEEVIKTFLNDSDYLTINSSLAVNFVKDYHDTNLISLKYIDVFLKNFS